MRRRFQGRVSNQDVVVRLQLDKWEPALSYGNNHNHIEGVWMNLKEAKGWRPKWTVEGFLSNGMSQVRATRILELYKQELDSQ